MFKYFTYSSIISHLSVSDGALSPYCMVSEWNIDRQMQTEKVHHFKTVLRDLPRFSITVSLKIVPNNSQFEYYQEKK